MFEYQKSENIFGSYYDEKQGKKITCQGPVFELDVIPSEESLARFSKHGVTGATTLMRNKVLNDPESVRCKLDTGSPITIIPFKTAEDGGLCREDTPQEGKTVTGLELKLHIYRDVTIRLRHSSSKKCVFVRKGFTVYSPIDALRTKEHGGIIGCDILWKLRLYFSPKLKCALGSNFWAFWRSFCYLGILRQKSHPIIRSG